MCRPARANCLIRSGIRDRNALCASGAFGQRDRRGQSVTPPSTLSRRPRTLSCAKPIPTREHSSRLGQAYVAPRVFFLKKTWRHSHDAPCFCAGTSLFAFLSGMVRGTTCSSLCGEPSHRGAKRFEVKTAPLHRGASPESRLGFSRSPHVNAVGRTTWAVVMKTYLRSGVRHTSNEIFSPLWRQAAAPRSPTFILIRA